MIRIGTPQDIENYIKVDDDMAMKLHLDKFFPRWKDGNYIYFLATEELIKHMKGGE